MLLRPSLGALALVLLASTEADAEPAPAPSPGDAEPAATTRGGPAPAPRPRELEPLPGQPPAGEKRAPQDYDGREDVTTVAEDALWIPRVLLFPLHVVTEYVIVTPLRALAFAIETDEEVGGVIRNLLFEPSTVGVTPTAFIEFGFRPSVGLVFYYNDLFAKGNDFRASFGFGGTRYWKVGAVDRIPIVPPIGTERSRSFVQIEADFLIRSDLRFWGIGPRTLDDDDVRYGIRTWGGGGRLHLEPWRGSFFEAWVTGRDTTTGPGECSNAVTVVDPYPDDSLGVARVCDPPTVRQRALQGERPPPGYARPYVTVKSGMRVVLDSRPERPAPGTGVAVDLSAEQASDVDPPARGSWFNLGASLAGFLDLTGTQRVLSLRLTARMIQPVDEEAYTLPFTELLGSRRIEDVPDLELMKGFRPGRLVGRSATAATLEYRWPVWAFLDAMVQTAVGNVWSDPHLDDFRFELLRFSFLGGIRSSNHRDHSFNLLFGVGTETFEQGAAPNSARILIGGTTGF